MKLSKIKSAARTLPPVFRRDFRYSQKLIKLGRRERGMDALDATGRLKAVFEREEN